MNKLEIDSLKKHLDKREEYIKLYNFIGNDRDTEVIIKKWLCWDDFFCAKRKLCIPNDVLKDVLNILIEKETKYVDDVVK